MSKKSEAPKKIPLRNWRNYEHKEGYEDYIGHVSMTMPDQAYTVIEIFEKFKAGVRLPIEREVYFSDTEDFDHPDGIEFIDIVDYHEHAEQVRNALKRDQGESSRKAATPSAEKLADQPAGKAEFQAANTP